MSLKHSEMINSGPQECPCDCDGNLHYIGSNFSSDVQWQYYFCDKCETSVKTVEGRPHWWNRSYELSEEDKKGFKKQLGL